MNASALGMAFLAAHVVACEHGSSPEESRRELPLSPPEAAHERAAVDPHLHAPPSDPTLGVLVGELSADESEGMLVLALDLADTLEGDCGEYEHRFSGPSFRCESVPLGLYTAFVRGRATRWARRPVYVKPGEITDLGLLELEALPPEAVIRGVVRDTLGQPLEDVELIYAISSCGGVHSAGMLYWTTSTNTAGEFVFHPEQRELMVDAFKEGYDLENPAWITGDMAEWGDVLDLVMTRQP